MIECGIMDQQEQLALETEPAVGEKGASKREVRVRIAPSPTGPIHIGLARTALFNYLFAKKQGGKFLLRIEDTDVERSDPKWEGEILEGLAWLGLAWDEGPDIGGPFGPYRQSERTETYTKYLRQLQETSHVYPCYCSEEELEAQRQDMMARGEAPRYSGKCRHLDAETLTAYQREGRSSILRFRMPETKVRFHDLIRGEIEFDTAIIGDIAIAKDEKTPLYNFAVLVDDFEMKITHVIRGEEHLSNTPKQIMLAKALEFPTPEYAHLPLILGPDRTKLSKRHGETSLLEYREAGYLPEALVNFMVLLGWNPKTEREIFSLKELEEIFSLANVQKAGAVFNIERLNWMNSFYIKKLSEEDLTEKLIPYWKKAGYPVEDRGYLVKIASLEQERIRRLDEIVKATEYFFQEPEYEKELLRWDEMTFEEVSGALQELEGLLEGIPAGEWNRTHLEEILMSKAEARGDKGKLLWPLRAALTGREASPGPFEIAEILGKEVTIVRVKRAIEKLL